MKNLIITSPEELKSAHCEELKRYDARRHPINIALMGAHGGRITSDELYQLTFNGKFNF